MSDPEGGRAGSGPGGGLGFVAALLMGPPLLFFLAPLRWVVAVVVVGGAFVLVSRDDPFQRDFGAGLLFGFAAFLLILGTCLATFAAVH